MKKQPKDFFRIQIAFLDMVTNLLLVFTALFILSFANVQKPTKNDDGNIRKNAQYVVETTWGGDLKSDIDTWVMTPSGRPVSYLNLTQGLVHLERDDMGSTRDTYRDSEGKEVILTENSETIVFRGTEPGRFIVNLFLYDLRDEGPIEVTVRIVRLNPMFQEIIKKTVTLTRKGDEQTVISFILSPDGTIVQQDELPFPFAGKLLRERKDSAPQ